MKEGIYQIQNCKPLLVVFHFIYIQSLKNLYKSIIRLIHLFNRKVNDIQTTLEQIYGRGTIEYNGTTLQLEPGITNLYESSRDPKVLSELWVKWRDATGKKMANLYTEFVELQNTGALEHGTQQSTVLFSNQNHASDHRHHPMIIIIIYLAFLNV